MKLDRGQWVDMSRLNMRMLGRLSVSGLKVMARIRFTVLIFGKVPM